MSDSGWVPLTLHQALFRDVYKDTARIHERHRGGIKEGTICRLSVKGAGSALVAIRGLKDRHNEESYLRIDEVTRERLKITHLGICAPVEVKLQKVWFFGRLQWAWNSSDPASNVAMQIAVISLVISLVTAVPFAKLFGTFFVWFGQWLLWLSNLCR